MSGKISLKLKKLVSFLKLIRELYRLTKVDLFLSYIIFIFSFIKFILSTNIKKNITSVLISEAGFGHTITDVEMINFVLNENYMVLILSEHKRHNWALNKAWKNIKVYNIRKTAPLFSSDTQLIMQKFCTNFIYRIYGLFNMKLIEFDNNFNRTYLKESEGIMSKLINKAKKFKDYDYISPKNYPSYFSYPNVYEGHYAYFFLRNKIHQDNIELLNSIKKRFSKRLNNLNKKNKQIINIYLRQKGNDLRCGSSIEVWSIVIKYLIDKGFFILITGDRSINSFPKEIRKYIFTHESFKMNKDIYSISAPYFCNYYISEMGGGSWLGMVMNKPVLMVNCWQYWGSGGTNFYLLFKNLLNKNTKKYVDIKLAIKKYFWEINVPNNHILECNDDKQIIQAFNDLYIKNKNIIQFAEIDYKFKHSWGSITNSKLVSSNKFDKTILNKN